MADEPNPPQVHVVDDDDGLRRGVQLLLRSVGLASTGYTDGTAFLDAYGAAPLRGCILSDLRMPGLSGLALMERLQARGNRLPFLMISGHGTIALAVQAVREGAFDFIEKPFDEQLLLDKVQAALAAEARAWQEAQRRALLFRRLERLSPRERDVLERVARGRLNKQVADDLHICINTVETHRANLMRKLEVGTLAELVHFAVAAGVVPVDTAAADPARGRDLPLR